MSSAKILCPRGMETAETGWTSKDHRGLGWQAVDETMADSTAKAPRLSGYHITRAEPAADLGRGGEPGSDRNKMHWRPKVALREMQFKLHSLLT